MGKQWSKREAQILAVGMVGDQQGIAGKAMPEIPSLDMPLPEASTEASQLASAAPLNDYTLAGNQRTEPRNCRSPLRV